MANSLTSFLNNLEQIATAAALEINALQAVDPDFARHSFRTEPTPGWEPAVSPRFMVPRGYQLATLETCLKFNGVIVGLEPGLGKTLIAAQLIANLAHEGKRTVVVVPPAIIEKPWTQLLSSEFPQLIWSVVQGQSDLPVDADLLIISEAILYKRVADLISWAPDAVVVDESQNYLDLTTKRTNALLELTDEVQGRGGKAVTLSGTITTNWIQDVLSQSLIVGRAEAVSGSTKLADFRTRWVNPSKVNGAIDQDLAKDLSLELHRRLRSACYVNIPREVALPDLPPKVWLPPVDVVPDAAAIAEYSSASADFLGWVREKGGVDAVVRAQRAEALVKLGSLLRLSGVAKAKSVAESAASLVQQGEQVVVMVNNVDVHNAIRDHLQSIRVGSGDTGRNIRTVSVMGGSTPSQKAQAQDVFASGEADVLIGNHTAAGVGISLDSARHLIFAQVPWSAGRLIQVSDRIYRLTQDRPCFIHFPIVPKTVEESQFYRVESKLAVTSAINTGQIAEMDNFNIGSEVTEEDLAEIINNLVGQLEGVSA